jgi:hypothetical protein
VETRVQVTNRSLVDLTRLLQQADVAYKDGIREQLDESIQPLAAEVEALALAGVRRMPRSPQWSDMRTGVAPDVAYVVPVQRGVKKANRRARPNLATLMLGRAMNPALEHQKPRIEREFDVLFGRVAADFNGGRL